MYVLPLETSFDKLCPASKEFYEYVTSEEYKDGEYVDDELDNRFSHFVALTRGVRNSPSQYYVISRKYFTETNRNKKVIARRISALTINKCYQKPNKLQVITTEDRRLINEHVRKCSEYNMICKIKKLELPHKKVEYIDFQDRTVTSEINYQGLDNDDTIHLLSDDWLEINFKVRFPRVYKIILDLKPDDTYYSLPSGSRHKKITIFPFKHLQHWTKVRFVQKRDPSCVVCSITSAIYHLQQYNMVYKIFEVYHHKNQNHTFIPSMEDVIDIIRNKYHKRLEKRFKYDIQKIKNLDSDDILHERNEAVYYCCLRNRHVIAMTQEYIFDSEFEKTLPRTRSGLRVSSETELHESVHNVITQCYRIEKK